MGMAVPKLIAGFLLGVVTTITAVYWFDEQPPVTQASLTRQSSLPEGTAEVQRANPTRTNDKVAEAGGEESNISTPAESVSNAEPLASQPQSIAVPQQGASSTNPAQRSSTRPTNNDYPPEIADMIENKVNKELQARYESDEREESWATYMEGQLAAYFAQKPALAQFYFSLTDCRTSICAVHALGYGPDALTLWNSATADLVSQPWFEFNSMSMNRRNPQPDVLGIVLIITKKPPD